MQKKQRKEYEAIGKQENNLHWCLDMLFSDDACKMLDRKMSENLAISEKDCV